MFEGECRSSDLFFDHGWWRGGALSKIEERGRREGGCKNHHKDRHENKGVQKKNPDAHVGPTVTRPKARTPLQQYEGKDCDSGNEKTMFPKEQRGPDI